MARKQQKITKQAVIEVEYYKHRKYQTWRLIVFHLTLVAHLLICVVLAITQLFDPHLLKSQTLFATSNQKRR